METGFLGVYETAPKPHIAILVEMDALPEIGHACGHNLIAECSIAAGLGVMEIMKKHNLKGKLSLLGTPAEELGGGKIHYVSEGFFDDVDIAIMSHPSNENVVHKSHLAVSQFKIAYTGKETHASVSPWLGVNALDAAVLAYQAISTFRQQMEPDCRIHGIIVHGGVATNIIPNYSELEYEIRAPTTQKVKELRNKIMGCFHGAAQATGCKVKVFNEYPTYEDLISNKILVNLYEKNASNLGICMDQDNGLSDGSSDVGNVSHVCSTIQPFFYIGTKCDIHTKEYNAEAGKEEAQKYVLTQAKIITGTLTEILQDGSYELLSQIKYQFHEDILKMK